MQRNPKHIYVYIQYIYIYNNLSFSHFMDCIVQSSVEQHFCDTLLYEIQSSFYKNIISLNLKRLFVLFVQCR